MGRRRADRGSGAIEMAILMPLFVALFTTGVVIGRTSNVVSAVEAAAYDAARTASLARDAGTAGANADAAVRSVLVDRGVECVGGPDVQIMDSSVFATPVGTPASVEVMVTCRVTYADVDLLGVPADATISASFVSPIDQYRARP